MRTPRRAQRTRRRGRAIVHTPQPTLPPLPSGKVDTEVDVCIPVHNAMSFVRTCFAFVSLNTEAPFRFVIHDDASAPPTEQFLTEWVQSVRRPVTLVRSDERVWFTSSVNRCLAHIRSPWVLVLNSDVQILDKRWFEKSKAAFLADPKTGLLGQVDHAYEDGWPQVAPGKVQGHFWFTSVERIRQVGPLRETEPSEVHIASDDAWSEAFRRHGFTNYYMTHVRIRHGWGDYPTGGASWGRDVSLLPKWQSVRRARMRPARIVFQSDDWTRCSQA